MKFEKSIPRATVWYENGVEEKAWSIQTVGMDLIFTGEELDRARLRGQARKRGRGHLNSKTQWARKAEIEEFDEKYGDL